MLISKSYYNPRYRGWWFVNALVKITDALVTLLVGPFGYDSNIYVTWCEHNLRQDVKRHNSKR